MYQYGEVYDKKRRCMYIMCPNIVLVERGSLAIMPGTKSIAGVALRVSTLGSLAILKAMPLYRYINALCATRARNECHYSTSLVLCPLLRVYYSNTSGTWTSSHTVCCNFYCAVSLRTTLVHMCYKKPTLCLKALTVGRHIVVLEEKHDRIVRPKNKIIHARRH